MFKELGKTLSDTRKDGGFTVTRMAEITGYSERSIYRYESGQLTPCLEYLVQISELCQISVDRLLGLKVKE